jgi:spore coat polysaccharide biosynthesis protein SpsF
VTRIRVVIQSRLSSSRLPGKALMMIGGMPLVELVARRASRSGHEVVVATSSEVYDERIAHHCTRTGLAVVRGSLDDVLSRFVLATEDLDPDDLVVRLTGDNPLADAGLVDELVAATRASQHTYGRVDIDQVPEGLGAEVFTAEALRLAHASTRDAYDREHVTPWLRRELGELLFVPEASPPGVDAYRATVDTLHDMVRVSTLFDSVEDPVGIPWQQLMARLVERVDHWGPRVPLAPTGPYSGIVVSARRFADDRGRPRSEHAEALRALVAGALDRGVTHVDVGGTDGRSAELLRACLEPAVTQRLGVVLRVGLAAAPVGPRATTLAAAIERDLARLGRRQVDTLVLESLEDEGAWELARAYRAAGVATRLGVVATDAEDLRRAAHLEGLEWVEVPPGVHGDDPALATLRSRGVVVAVDPGGGPPPSWCTVRLLATTDRSDLDAALLGVETLRATPGG